MTNAETQDARIVGVKADRAQRLLGISMRADDYRMLCSATPSVGVVVALAGGAIGILRLWG
jgi:hypothetical protein